jgi:hypothetical protein
MQPGLIPGNTISLKLSDVHLLIMLYPSNQLMARLNFVRQSL